MLQESFRDPDPNCHFVISSRNNKQLCQIVYCIDLGEAIQYRFTICVKIKSLSKVYYRKLFIFYIFFCYIVALIFYISFISIFQNKLYPTVGLQTPGEEVDANFGQEPFKFDQIEDMMKQMRAEMTATIHDFPLPAEQGDPTTLLQK